MWRSSWFYFGINRSPLLKNHPVERRPVLGCSHTILLSWWKYSGCVNEGDWAIYRQKQTCRRTVYFVVDLTTGQVAGWYLWKSSEMLVHTAGWWQIHEFHSKSWISVHLYQCRQIGKKGVMTSSTVNRVGGSNVKEGKMLVPGNKDRLNVKGLSTSLSYSSQKQREK